MSRRHPGKTNHYKLITSKTLLRKWKTFKKILSLSTRFSCIAFLSAILFTTTAFATDNILVKTNNAVSVHQIPPANPQELNSVFVHTNNPVYIHSDNPATHNVVVHANHPFIVSSIDRNTKFHKTPSPISPIALGRDTASPGGEPVHIKTNRPVHIYPADSRAGAPSNYVAIHTHQPVLLVNNANNSIQHLPAAAPSPAQPHRDTPHCDTTAPKQLVFTNSKITAVVPAIGEVVNAGYWNKNEGDGREIGAGIAGRDSQSHRYGKTLIAHDGNTFVGGRAGYAGVNDGNEISGELHGFIGGERKDNITISHGRSDTDINFDNRGGAWAEGKAGVSNRGGVTTGGYSAEAGAGIQSKTDVTENARMGKGYTSSTSGTVDAHAGAEARSETNVTGSKHGIAMGSDSSANAGSWAEVGGHQDFGYKKHKLIGGGISGDAGTEGAASAAGISLTDEKVGFNLGAQAELGFNVSFYISPKGTAQALGDALAPTGKKIAGAAEYGFGKTKSGTIDAYDKSAHALETAYSRSADGVVKAYDKSAVGLQSAYDKSAGGLQSGYEQSAHGLTQAYDKSASGLKSGYEQSAHGVTQAYDKSAAGVTKAADTVGKGTEKAAGAVSSGATKAADEVSSGAKKAGKKIKHFFKHL